MADYIIWYGSFGKKGLCIGRNGMAAISKRKKILPENGKKVYKPAFGCASN